MASSSEQAVQQPAQVLQALVFGASGISGHSILKELLVYPTPTTFSRIIGLTNRTLHKDTALLPEDERIELYSELDLRDRNKSLFHLQHVPGIEHTTHVYYTAYAGHGSDYQELKRINTEILTNAVGSVEICCPKLQFFTLQTGGKAYGVEFADKVPYNPPLSETLPRIPDPYASNIFYYAQADIMSIASAGKPWTWCEIRPDAIVGFVPNGNAMALAMALGLFLSMYKFVNGAGSEVPFPGSEKAYEALHTDTSQDILARFHIHASLHAAQTGGRAFNVVDGPATTWSAVWPELCAYFSLVGTPPPGNGNLTFDLAAWMQTHRHEWAAWEETNGLRAGALNVTSFDFAKAVLGIGFRRDYDASASREVGFEEVREHVEGYRRTFDEMRRAKLIP